MTAPTPNKSSDQALLEAWQGGDSDAGAELFERHWRSIARFFTNKLGADCEDLVQQTFLACVESKSKYRGDSSFRGFLFGIARNKLLHHLRAKGRYQKRFDPGTVSIAASARSHTSIIAADRKRAKLLLAMRQLPVDTQTMLELHYWEQLPVREIAKILELTPEATRTRMFRGRRKLAELLGEGGDAALTKPE